MTHWSLTVVAEAESRVSDAENQLISRRLLRMWLCTKQACLASSLGCQHDTARICCCGAVAAERWRLLSIYISCPRALSSKPAGCRCCRWNILTVDRWLGLQRLAALTNVCNPIIKLGYRTWTARRSVCQLNHCELLHDTTVEKSHINVD